MDETDIRNLVKGWHQRARTERDLTTKFVYLWFCFNAWLAYESGLDMDSQMIKWLGGASSTESQLKRAYEKASASSLFGGYVKTLVELSPIRSTGRGRRRMVTITSTTDFRGILRGIYQVRCNLFHGGKSPDDVRDQKLVRVCARILEKWIGNLVSAWLV